MVTDLNKAHQRGQDHLVDVPDCGDQFVGEERRDASDHVPELTTRASAVLEAFGKVLDRGDRGAGDEVDDRLNQLVVEAAEDRGDELDPLLEVLDEHVGEGFDLGCGFRER